MTMIKKKFEKIEDGINNMLDAAAHDYKSMGSTYRTSEEFRARFMIKPGQKYIKIGRKSDHTMVEWVKFGVSLLVLILIRKFKKGDVLKAAGFNAPARNAPRGNVLDGGFSIRWTGPLYL